MAQIITFWAMQDDYDVEIRNVKIKNKGEIASVMATLPEGTDVVTLGRTDRQSPIIHEIWKSERYVDLNERKPRKR